MFVKSDELEVISLTLQTGEMESEKSPFHTSQGSAQLGDVFPDISHILSNPSSAAAISRRGFRRHSPRCAHEILKLSAHQHYSLINIARLPKHIAPNILGSSASPSGGIKELVGVQESRKSDGSSSCFISSWSKFFEFHIE